MDTFSLQLKQWVPIHIKFVYAQHLGWRSNFSASPETNKIITTLVRQAYNQFGAVWDELKRQDSNLLPTKLKESRGQFEIAPTVDALENSGHWGGGVTYYNGLDNPWEIYLARRDEQLDEKKPAYYFHCCGHEMSHVLKNLLFDYIKPELNSRESRIAHLLNEGFAEYFSHTHYCQCLKDYCGVKGSSALKDLQLNTLSVTQFNNFITTNKYYNLSLIAVSYIMTQKHDAFVRALQAAKQSDFSSRDRKSIPGCNTETTQVPAAYATFYSTLLDLIIENPNHFTQWMEERATQPPFQDKIYPTCPANKAISFEQLARFSEAAGNAVWNDLYGSARTVGGSVALNESPLNAKKMGAASQSSSSPSYWGVQNRVLGSSAGLSNPGGRQLAMLSPTRATSFANRPAVGMETTQSRNAFFVPKPQNSRRTSSSALLILKQLGANVEKIEALPSFQLSQINEFQTERLEGIWSSLRPYCVLNQPQHSPSEKEILQAFFKNIKNEDLPKLSMLLQAWSPWAVIEALAEEFKVSLSLAFAENYLYEIITALDDMRDSGWLLTLAIAKEPLTMQLTNNIASSRRVV